MINLPVHTSTTNYCIALLFVSLLVGVECDANDYANLPEWHGSKYFAPSATGACSCGAEWDARHVQDEWLDVEDCYAAYNYTAYNINGNCRSLFFPLICLYMHGDIMRYLVKIRFRAYLPKL